VGVYWYAVCLKHREILAFGKIRDLKVYELLSSAATSRSPDKLDQERGLYRVWSELREVLSQVSVHARRWLEKHRECEVLFGGDDTHGIDELWIFSSDEWLETNAHTGETSVLNPEEYVPDSGCKYMDKCKFQSNLCSKGYAYILCPFYYSYLLDDLKKVKKEAVK